ncbi:hypothetical protein [Mucilaginibacter sp. KACC 22063]|nr:hypothetical protein [Mucilaginibacter sp. KACC 22063]WDF53686.1 hypothetical protein PQ461_12090 [Mucilaginibacter sp. KACC 22063]
MRIDPSEEVIRKEEIAKELKEKTDRITRIVAIVVAFLSTYMLFLKILFL